jgi:predicted transcriptional regulator
MQTPHHSNGAILVIDLDDPNRGDLSLRALKALASEPRLDILRLLSGGPANVKDIAENMGMPLSTATLHVRALEEGGLIGTEVSAASRGLQKMCSRRFETVLVRLPGEQQPGRVVQASIPVGTFTQISAEAPCGLAGPNGVIGLFDDPCSFYEPARSEAQLLWFARGSVEYAFPHRLPPKARPLGLTLSLELCSEAPLSNPDWPSDISFWINGRELGTWTSPADFGGTRGLLTPEWWETAQSQFGLLKQITVNEGGTFVDGMKLSDVTVGQLDLTAGSVVRLRIGVKAEAVNPGGVNLFGRGFGNYPQDIVVQIRYGV